LKTATKMFCRCPASGFDAPANTHICPVCTGQPGTLPTPNRKAIESLAHRFHAWCWKRHKTFAFSLSTNGTLLTRETVKRLLPYGLKHAQISVDGLPEVHDKRRPFKGSGKPTYEIVMKNLQDVVDLLRVSIAGTYSPETRTQIPAFLDHLVASGLAGKIDTVQFDMESPFLSDGGAKCSRSSSCSLSSEANLASALWLRYELLARGIGLEKTVLHPSACALGLQNGRCIIAPDGAIYKCSPLLGQPQYAMGHVDQEELGDRHADAMTRELWRECLEQTDCPFVYFCGNGCGCRFRALLQTGDLWSLACERRYFEKAVPEFMKLEHERLQLAEARQAGEA